MKSKYKSKILVWEKTTPYKEGPDLEISREELPLPSVGKRKYVAWAQPFSKRIYISDNCKFRDVWWAHESGHFDLEDSRKGMPHVPDSLHEEMLADMKAVALYGADKTARALKWLRDNWCDAPTEEFRKAIDARIGFVKQLGELLEKYQDNA